MTTKPQRGGLRTPAGGRPRKGNVKWYCYLGGELVAYIDQERGALTRGEFITLLMANYAITKSNREPAEGTQ